MKAAKEILKYVILAVITGYSASWAIAQLNLEPNLFKKDDFMGALVTFSTGAMVSIFLAVFHSSNEKLSMLREKYHAKTLYLLVVVCNALIVFLSGFADSSRVLLGVGADSLAVTTAFSLGVLLIWFVSRIIGLYFAKPK